MIKQDLDFISSSSEFLRRIYTQKKIQDWTTLNIPSVLSFFSLFLDQVPLHGGSHPIYSLNASIMVIYLGGG